MKELLAGLAYVPSDKGSECACGGRWIKNIGEVKDRPVLGQHE
jgi:hypothetical protein